MISYCFYNKNCSLNASVYLYCTPSVYASLKSSLFYGGLEEVLRMGSIFEFLTLIFYILKCISWAVPISLKVCDFKMRTWPINNWFYMSKSLIYYFIEMYSLVSISILSNSNSFFCWSYLIFPISSILRWGSLSNSRYMR